MRDVIRAEEHTHTPDTQQYPRNLRPSIPDLQKQERQYNHHDNSPEIDKLGAQNRSIAVREDDEVIPLYVDEGEDEEAPAVL